MWSYQDYQREYKSDKWSPVVDDLFNANNYRNGVGIQNRETDILYCYEYYAEPKFRYEDQEAYWKA